MPVFIGRPEFPVLGWVHMSNKLWLWVSIYMHAAYRVEEPRTFLTASHTAWDASEIKQEGQISVKEKEGPTAFQELFEPRASSATLANDATPSTRLGLSLSLAPARSLWAWYAPFLPPLRGYCSPSFVPPPGWNLKFVWVKKMLVKLIWALGTFFGSFFGSFSWN